MFRKVKFVLSSNIVPVPVYYNQLEGKLNIIKPRKGNSPGESGSVFTEFF
jgi:hypothetical protein